MIRISFSDDQRSRLREHGVIDEQLLALEKVLPLCHSMWADRAPLNAVRDELRKLANALHRACRQLKAMENADQKRIHLRRREAYSNLQIALVDMGIDLENIQVIHRIAEAVDRALADLLPSKQRRPHAALPHPVHLLDDALHTGWAAQKTRYPHAPSIAPEGRFRAIVGICYEAFTGKQDSDPERAIKAYLLQLKRKKPASKIKVIEAAR